MCPIRSQHSLDRLEMVRWESVPRGSSAHAWKLSSRLLTRPDWLPLGLRGCLLFQTFGKVVWKNSEHQLYGTYIETCSQNRTEKNISVIISPKVKKTGQLCLCYDIVDERNKFYRHRKTWTNFTFLNYSYEIIWFSFILFFSDCKTSCSYSSWIDNGNVLNNCDCSNKIKVVDFEFLKCIPTTTSNL